MLVAVFSVQPDPRLYNEDSVWGKKYRNLALQVRGVSNLRQ
jgi:hypothetical protein